MFRSCIETQVSLICANLPQMSAAYKRYIRDTGAPPLGMLGAMVINVYRLSTSLKITLQGGDHSTTTAVPTSPTPITAGSPTVHENEHSGNEDSFYELPSIEQAYQQSHHSGNEEDRV